MGHLHDLIAEWRARRAGAKYAPRDIQKSARHIIGPTGAGFSNAWEKMAEGTTAYLDSFDRKVPPSIFISQRDRARIDNPIPLIERRIEAISEDDGLTAEEIEWGRQPPTE